MAAQFNIYVKELRLKKFQQIPRLAAFLKIKYEMWRKIERGINPPPKKSLLVKFCNLVGAKEYEKNQLFALAKRWTPHPDTGSLRHPVYHEGLDREWTEAVLAENTPDYTVPKEWSKSN